MRIFINERPLDVPDGTPLQAAVAAFDPALAGRLAAGAAHVTDGRGIRLQGNEALTNGAILRVVVSARQGDDRTHADA